ncbi:MAG TPA: ANTAR domain-containing protein [Acidimicrobiia bacterium]|nr:ANTAR domain-containing protein [Acidimicrobiia bacterium]
MISVSDLHALHESFATWDEPGLPSSLAADCARVLGVSDITISFLGASDQVRLCSSSDDARSVDEWEFTLQEGPCFDAAVTGNSATGETAPSHTNPWPRLSAKAHAIGYRAIAGIACQVEGTTFATLNLQDRHGTITPETIADAEHIASELSSLLLDSLGKQPRFLDQPADHDTFHQATGLVMAQMGIDAGSAVEVLRAHAWSHDRLLVEVASEVVARTLTFPPARPSSLQLDG